MALAATAGIAVENARLYDLARSREEWSATTADVMAAMLQVSGEDVLEIIVERVGALIDVDLVGVVVPHGTTELLVTTVRGPSAELWRGRVFAAEGTLASRALATRRAASVGARSSVAAGFPGLGPTVAVPLFAGEEPLGVLIISRRPGSPGFADADVDLAFAFGAQAGVAIEIVRARDDRRRLELSRDRARIARDLHDHVIHRLFGAGLSLQAVSGTVDRDASAAIEAQIDAVDAAIKDIRTIIFALGSEERAKGRRVRDRMLDVVSELSAAMPATPRVIFSGPLDSVVSPSLADDLTAVLRECLLNVVKHAGAEFVEIDLGIADGDVLLRVEDDGRGPSLPAELGGLANLTDRARLRGGTCTIGVGTSGGTRIEWAAPVHDQRARTANVINVFLVDDHEIVRRGIAQLIDAESDLRVVGEAGSFEQATRRLAATAPDVVILDMRLPDGDGIDLCRDIRSARPEVACLILTAYDDDAALRSAVLAGASGYVLKDIRSRELIGAIRRAAAGGMIPSKEVMSQAASTLDADVRDESPIPALSLREGQVLGLIAEGLTNREIGIRLGLAEKTVKNYVSGLLAKLGMERRTQAAVYGAGRNREES